MSEPYYDNNNNNNPISNINQTDDDMYDERSHRGDHDSNPIDSLTLTMACLISFVLFSIAGGIFIWFLRDCREYQEENKDRVQMRKDAKEAEENKKDEKKRKRAIDATIDTKTLVIDENDNCTESITSSYMSSQVDESEQRTEVQRANPVEDEENQAPQKNSSNDDSTNSIQNDDIDENICSICLEPFYNNEELSWSKDKKCQHVFHSECLIPWLMKHEECPVCRTEFMTTRDFLDRTYCEETTGPDERKEEKDGERIGRESNEDEEQEDVIVDDANESRNENENTIVDEILFVPENDQSGLVSSFVASVNDYDNEDDVIANLEEGRFLGDITNRSNHHTIEHGHEGNTNDIGTDTDNDTDNDTDRKKTTTPTKVVNKLISKQQKKKCGHVVYEEISRTMST